MKKKLLFLAAFLPASNAAQAGQKTAFRNLTWLQESFDITIGAFRNETDRAPEERRLRDLCEEIYIEPLSNAGRIQGLLGHPTLPLQVAARRTNRMAQWVQAVIARRMFDRVHFEWSQMLTYQEWARQIPCRTVYVHDVLSQWAARRALNRGFPWKLEERRCSRWERQAYDVCHKIFVPSAKDGQLIESIRPSLRGRIAMLPLQFDRYGPCDSSSARMALRLLFWGALSREENASAARWVIREILPRLNQPGTVFHLTIAGSNPPKDIVAHQSHNLTVPGFVEDPDRFFKEGHLAILPIFDGAGVKVKVLECLAAGLPVLTTTIGAEGISAGADDGLIVLPPRPGEFVAQIERLASNDAERKRLSEGALRWGQRQSEDHRSILMHAVPMSR